MQTYQHYVWWKTYFYDKRTLLFSLFLEILGWVKNMIFSKKSLPSPFFGNVCRWHKMVTFFQKMSEKYPPKIVKTMFCYVKTLFVKSDKVAELTFLGRIFSFYGLRFGPNLRRRFLPSVVCMVFPYKQQKGESYETLLYTKN